MAVKIGSTEATVDPQFNQLETEFKEVYSKMKRLGKEVQNYQTAIKGQFEWQQKREKKLNYFK